MQETETRTSQIIEYLKKTLLDPVLWYTVMIMTTIMYHYYDTYTFRFAVASFVLTYLLFRLFDFMNKRRLIGAVLYIAAGYLFFSAAQEYMARGYDYYTDVLGTRPMSYGFWFITPQLAMDYNIWYSCATFALFMFFMASVVYYFTRIRYRVFMSFLIFMFPFIIYGKEYERMETPFVIILSVGYIVVMMYCREIRGDSKNIIVGKRDLISSAGVFTVIFAIAASIVPKPQINENREALETLIAAERFTDRLVERLSSFRGNSSGSQFRQVTSNVQLYYAESPEPLRLKTSTYTSYSYEFDTWNASTVDSTTQETFYTTPSTIADDPGTLAQAILTAADADRSYAEEYGLTGFTGSRIVMPEKRKFRICSVYETGRAAPVPQLATALSDTTYSGKMSLMRTGLVMTSPDDSAYNEQFTFDYGADTFFAVSTNKAFIDAVDAADYHGLLLDAQIILESEIRKADRVGDAERYDTLSRYYDAVAYELEIYKEAQDQLDYSENRRIADLASQITYGLTTDYDKAKALEIYFYTNGFNYDLQYVKSQGENVENFLFNTKRGVCYEYATAMVLMARSCGIPARYCEGYNMQSMFVNNRLGTNYVITARDAHGYPELYIKGFGWTSFEPTISDGEVTQQREQGAATNSLTRAGRLLLIIAVIALIVYLVYPFAVHRIFIMINRRREPNAAVIAVMRRIYRVYLIDKQCTAGEALIAVREYSGADISEACRLFDEAAYGEGKMNEADRSKAIEVYISAYDAYRQARRSKRRFAFKRT